MKEVEFLITQNEIINTSMETYDANIWSLKKLILLARYIPIHLNILTAKKNGEYKYCDSWFYIDLFSGPGANTITNKVKSIGSPIISILKGIRFVKKRNEFERFTKWFFIDLNRGFCNALAKRSAIALKLTQKKCEKEYGKSINASIEDIEILKGDCNTKIDNVLREIEQHERCSILVFIDPEGLKEIEWNTLKKLLEKKYVDVIYILSTVGLKRGINEQILGKNLPPLTEKEKRKILSRSYSSEEYVKIFAKYILKELKRRRLFYTSLPIINEKKTEIYRIVWASSSPGAAKAIKSTLDMLEHVKNEDLISIIKVISGEQTNLDRFCLKSKSK